MENISRSSSPSPGTTEGQRPPPEHQQIPEVTLDDTAPQGKDRVPVIVYSARHMDWPQSASNRASTKKVPWKLSVPAKVMLRSIFWQGSQPGEGSGVSHDQGLTILDPWLLAWLQVPDAVMQ